MSLIVRSILLCIVIVANVGCGRYSKPRPPEDFAPATVKELQITGQIEGVKLEWKAPTTDARGKNLKEIAGYRIYRRSLTTIGEIARLKGDERLLTEIPDTHLKEIEEIRKTLLSQERPARRADFPKERYAFTYTDAEVAPSARYAYRVVPVNQGDVEGVFDKVGQVLFKGDRSEIALIDVAK